MNLKVIDKGLPSEVTNQLMPNEKVFYFTYIAFKGGCSSSEETDKYWLALTDRRVVYKTKVSEKIGKTQNFVEKDGDLPFNKISFIEISEGQITEGCNTSKVFQLRISTSGGTIEIPVPTKEKGHEIRKTYSHLSHEEK